LRRVSGARRGAFDRDLRTIERRLEWLARYVSEATKLEAEKAKLEQRRRQFKTA
jgi:hypothetical protein